jgi:hypothetical protein
MCIYLIGTTEAYQLLKLPSFVKHYFEHSQEDPQLTLMAFIKMHYNETVDIDGDWQKDMQLPFKTHEDGTSLLPLGYFPPTHVTPLRAPVLIVSKPRIIPFHQFLFDLYSADIFQPPRHWVA